MIWWWYPFPYVTFNIIVDVYIPVPIHRAQVIPFPERGKR